MSKLRVGIVGFDITPRFHPTCGAWGTTPDMTEVDMPLLARCLVLEQGDRRLIWFSSDLVGETVPGTDTIREEMAQALGMKREQIIWSTSQTHSSGAVPGSAMTGSSICELTEQYPQFMQAERRRFMNAYIEAAREAIDLLQPVRVWAGRGYCDSISYNSRFPMPSGGCKFSRNYAEGLQGGKYFDPTIGLIRFEDINGKPIGAIFNFSCHPAVLIMGKHISPDYVGTARQYIEEAIGGAPAMFVQGFCGDVHPYHMFGTPELAKRIGTRLGKAAVEALSTLIPVRTEPFRYAYKTIELPCRPMYSRQELEEMLATRQAFIDELAHDQAATWFCGINAPEQLSREQKKAFVQIQMAYLRKGLCMIETGQSARTSLVFTIGAVRIGDVAAVLSPGENFALAGANIRSRSPFTHTLICGDTNGLFGYIGDDVEINRGGYETNSYWKMLCIDGFRLALAKGTTDIIRHTCLDFLNQLQQVPAQRK